MSHWEAPGKSNEWLTPPFVFEALGCQFDTDVASCKAGDHVPAIVPQVAAEVIGAWMDCMPGDL